MKTIPAGKQGENNIRQIYSLTQMQKKKKTNKKQIKKGFTQALTHTLFMHRIPMQAILATIYILKSLPTCVLDPPSTRTVSFEISAFSLITAAGGSTGDRGCKRCTAPPPHPPTLHVIKAVVGTSDSPVSLAEHE